MIDFGLICGCFAGSYSFRSEFCGPNCSFFRGVGKLSCPAFEGFKHCFIRRSLQLLPASSNNHSDIQKGTFPISAGATSTSSSTAGDAAQSLSSNSSSHPLSTGAIAGIAVAAAIIGLLAAIGIGAFLWRRKTRPRQNLVPAAEHSHVAEVAGDQQQQRYGTTYKKDAEGSHAVEIGDTAITQQNSLSELPVGE